MSGDSIKNCSWRLSTWVIILIYGTYRLCCSFLLVLYINGAYIFFFFFFFFFFLCSLKIYYAFTLHLIYPVPGTRHPTARHCTLVIELSLCSVPPSFIVLYRVTHHFYVCISIDTYNFHVYYIEERMRAKIS